MEQKIDLVYLWLDDNDPAWRAAKEKWQRIECGDAPDLKSESLTPARWRDNDELRYSLRSAATFAPWINHIFIVTGFGHVPKWLDTSNPKISIIDHREIMPADALPVFNSVAIENCVVNIPGLSEYFLYGNDDTFFGQPLGPADFFDDNGNVVVNTVIHNVKSADVAYSQYHKSLFHTAGIYRSVFGDDRSRYWPAHNIDAYRKSFILELLQNPKIAAEYEKSIRSRFRNALDMQRWIFSIDMIARGRAIINAVVTPRSRKHFIYNLINKINGNFERSTMYTLNARCDRLGWVRPMLFCINDTEVSTDADRRDNREFLEKMFPDKCGFEK